MSFYTCLPHPITIAMAAGREYAKVSPSEVADLRIALSRRTEGCQEVLDELTRWLGEAPTPT